MNVQSNFGRPRSRYYGEVKPENLVFDANLQEFAYRVSLISNLATGGKLTLEQAYDEIQALWTQLEYTKKHLGVGQNPFSQS